MSDTAERGSAEMRYLLGELSEDEQARLEEAFFADDTKLDELNLAEEELIDSYVRDQLSPGQQRQFKTKLLRSPRLVKRVNFARALTEKADAFLALEAEDSTSPLAVSIPAKSQRRRWWSGLFAFQPAFGSAFAASTALLLIGGGILLYSWLRLRNESERLSSERAEVQRQKDELETVSREQGARIQQLDTALQQAQNQQAQAQQRIKELELAQKTTQPDQSVRGSILSFILTTGSLRSEGGSKKPIRIGSSTTDVRLILRLEKDDHRSYDVNIENIDTGAPIQKTRLKPNRTKAGAQLTFQIPAQKLPAGTYIVNVSGRTPSGTLKSVTESQFTVVRE